MSYDLKDVTVSVFDIHTTVEPMEAQSTEYFQPAFSFLIDDAGYRRLYTSDQVVKTAHFEFRHLPKGDVDTHFWDAYASIRHNGPPDVWKLQMPFVCRPSTVKVDLNIKVEDAKVSVRTEIYLSALGWSTHILIRFQKSIKNKQLISVMNNLISKKPDTMPLLVDGKPKTLTQTFQFFQELLWKEVYVEDNPPHPGIKILRHYIVSLNRFDGAPVGYDEMPPADQGMMRGFLVGKEIDAIQEIVEQEKHPLLVTHISLPHNFALTDFDHGTLVFLQRDAQDTEREGAVHCFHHNVRACIMMAYVLLNFYKLSDFADPKTPLGLLRENVRKTLWQMPKKYPNQFCQNLFKSHSALNEIKLQPN